jgi:hypothetical protein
MDKRWMDWVGGAFLAAGIALAAWYFPYRLDYGDVREGVYRNAFFRLRLSVRGWFPVDTELAKWRDEVVRDPGKGSEADARRPPAWTRSNLHLVTVYDRGWTQPGEYNPSLFAFAERRVARPKAQSAEEYLRSVIVDMAAGHREVRVPEPLVMSKVGGKWMARMRVEMQDPSGRIFRQEYYSIMRRGYFLSFVLSWERPEDRQRLQNLFDTLRFR